MATDLPLNDDGDVPVPPVDPADLLTVWVMNDESEKELKKVIPDYDGGNAACELSCRGRLVSVGVARITAKDKPRKRRTSVARADGWQIKRCGFQGFRNHAADHIATPGPDARSTQRR